MPSWRDELIEMVKSKAERDDEERERHKKRVEEALTTAETAMSLGGDSLRFAIAKLREKEQPAELADERDRLLLTLRDYKVTLELNRETAVIKVAFGETKPREFDFAKDRHIAPADVEEYVGRRALELVRSAQKTSPW